MNTKANYFNGRSRPLHSTWYEFGDDFIRNLFFFVVVLYACYIDKNILFYSHNRGLGIFKKQ